MKIVREHINEKFIEESDPIRDLGIGIYVERSFDTLEGAADFLLKVIPIIYKTNKIPDNILKIYTKSFKEFTAQDHLDNDKYEDLCKYVSKYIKIPSMKGFDQTTSFVITKLFNKLEKMGYKTWNRNLNEKFSEESDPVYDLGIGIRKAIEDSLQKFTDLMTDHHFINLYKYEIDGSNLQIAVEYPPYNVAFKNNVDYWLKESGMMEYLSEQRYKISSGLFSSRWAFAPKTEYLNVFNSIKSIEHSKEFIKSYPNGYRRFKYTIKINWN